MNDSGMKEKDWRLAHQPVLKGNAMCSILV
jgi:hypothetical protein